jgi:hypothetical protein
VELIIVVFFGEPELFVSKMLLSGVYGGIFDGYVESEFFLQIENCIF